MGLGDDVVQLGALRLELGVVRADVRLHLWGVAEPQLADGTLVDVHIAPAKPTPRRVCSCPPSPDREAALTEALSLDTLELVGRVLLAAALGGVIGIEREFSEQPAGFRTHILVSLGAALFTLVGAYGVEPFIGADPSVRFDPTRIAAQVVTGIGFLGAGAILQQGVNVRGLTTAAALWVTAAVGTAVGLGYFVGAITTTLTTVIALYALKRLGRRVFRRLRGARYTYALQIGHQLKLSDLARVLEGTGARTEALRLLTDEEGNRHVVASIDLPSAESPEALAETLGAIPGVETVDLED